MYIMCRAIGIYKGVLALSFLFLLAATFICFSLFGMFGEGSLPMLVAIGCAVEVILFLCVVNSIKKGSAEILEKVNNYELVKELYSRVLYLMGFGIMFSLIIAVIHCGISCTTAEHSDAMLIYVLNLFVPSAFIFVWIYIEIRRIKNLLKD